MCSVGWLVCAFVCCVVVLSLCSCCSVGLLFCCVVLWSCGVDVGLLCCC